MESQRIVVGSRVVSSIVSNLICRIVETAVEVYDLKPDQANALRKAFCQRDLYSIVPS